MGKHAEHVLSYRGSLIRAAQLRGHEVHAITGPAESDAARARLAAASVALHEVPLDGGGANPFKDTGTLRAIRAVVEAIRPDAAFCYNPKFMAFGPVAAKQAGVPRIAAMVTGLGYAFTGGGMRRALVRFALTRLYRRAFRCCDMVFFQNRDDLAEFTRHRVVDPSTPTAVVPGSGVDLERFTPSPPPEGVHFLMISRLLRDKGVVEFAEASHLVKATHPGARFTLLGGRDANPTAIPRELVERWVARGVPILVAPTPDVRPALAACTIFVLPSYREGTSKVMLEAMATGRAIITTDAVGCREPIEPGVNGLLVPVGAVEPLAAAMRSLADDRVRVEGMGRESRRIAETRFAARLVDDVILAALGLDGPQR